MSTGPWLGSISAWASLTTTLHNREDRVSSANPGFVRFHARFSGKCARPGLGNILAALRLWALGALVAGLVTFGCGAYATLEISAPPIAIAGSPFTITVTAMVKGEPAIAIGGALISRVAYAPQPNVTNPATSAPNAHSRSAASILPSPGRAHLPENLAWKRTKPGFALDTRSSLL